jgi:diguanylate cyclase (GGDEF)-like protein
LLATIISYRDKVSEAASSVEALRIVSDNSDSIVYVSDLDTYELLFINKAFASTYDAQPLDLIGKKCYEVLQKNQDGPCSFCPISMLIDKNGLPKDETYEWEFQNTVTQNWYWCKDSIIRWTDGRFVHFELAMDISARKEKEDVLKEMASLDTMTGTFNREWGYKLLHKIKVEAVNDQNPNTLCFIDLDGLKLCNDTLGHSAGDEMILGVLNYIRKRVRKDDIICRWGGDEFLLLLRCDAENARRVMRSIQLDLDAHNLTAKPDSPVLSFSYGIADLNANMPIDETITVADQAMYEDKISKKFRRQ